MNLLVVVVAGGLGGLGVLLMLRGLIGVTTPLSSIVAELHRPRHPAATRSRREVLTHRLAGERTAELDRDLAVCERSIAAYLQQRQAWAAMFVVPGAATVVLSAAGALAVVSPAVALTMTGVGAVAGWFYARLDLRADAMTARREFRHALAAYLELVTILLSGGAGVETAMFDAAAAGRGSAFRQLRAALSAAQARREAPWRSLGELGDRLGVVELAELEASMTLAGGGAQVRDSLTAKAKGIRLKDLTEIETEAQARSETMVLPVVLMFAGFLTLIGYPALAALSTTP